MVVWISRTRRLPWLETTGHQNFLTCIAHSQWSPQHPKYNMAIFSEEEIVCHFWSQFRMVSLNPWSMPTMLCLFWMRLDTSWAYPDKSSWILRERRPCASRCTWNEFVEQLPLLYRSSNCFITTCTIYLYIYIYELWRVFECFNFNSLFHLWNNLQNIESVP